MVFGNLIISQATNTPLRYKRKNELILKNTFVDGFIMNSFATLTFHEQFQTFDDDFYEIFINPREGCVIYDKTTEFVVNKLEEPVSNGNYDKNSNSDAINLTLGRISSNTTVIIEITCMFTASLTKLNSYTFYFPTEKPSQIKSSEGKITLKDDHLIISSIKLKSSFHLQFEFPETIESTAFSTKIDCFNYVGLSIHPTSFANNSIIKQEIYLLIDCSGSMKGDKIKHAQAALVNFLHELPKNCYFNILRFGSTFEQMFEHSVENNPKNISDSLKYASMLKANLRGTDIYSPLMSIINEKPIKGYVRQVFALTDGEVRTLQMSLRFVM